MTKQPHQSFPDGFLWGASTAAHQVEGGQVNDWSEWEQANAETLATNAEGNYAHWLPNWEQIKLKAENPSNYISGRAADHYHRYEEDFDLMHLLGMTSYRFSIEWSRIEPQPGKWDIEELKHYADMVRALKSRGIEPFVTLWHWPLPVWLRDKGGWLSRDTPELFARYSLKVHEYLGENVRFWITLNEPEVWASQAYYRGIWPPNHTSKWDALRVTRNLMRGHKLAYKAIKKTDPEAQVGIAKNNAWYEAAEGSLYDKFLAKAGGWLSNHLWLYIIRRHQDFIGLNHYFHNRIHEGKFNQNAGDRKSDLGWELMPSAIYPVLIELKRYKKPLYITENGLADSTDSQRAWFIEETVKAMNHAITDGVDLRGYMHWSLLDNFEWAEGFWPRFGLIEVDYQTFERTIRPSARRYSEIIKSSRKS
jgi:beta-glucosidase